MQLYFYSYNSVKYVLYNYNLWMCRTGKDELVTYNNSRHVLVLYKGQFYTFDVLDSNGVLLIILRY